MNKEVIKVINQIGSEIAFLFNSVLEEDSISINSKVNKNTLRDSNLRKDFQQNIKITDSVVIENLFNHYIDFIEKGRTPKYKKIPPISSLRDWAMKNGIATDNRTLYIISYVIWRDGYAARPILSKLDELVEKQFDSIWSLDLFNVIIDELNKYFNE
ncbi:hypothetical protein EZS27_016878 [termite gut metagenome]|uniref:Uncharacterized protein n=1 Tax=termite gut metagenome TaxID=433724 RepID=A0A5J4RL69_9ZZZZ